MIDTVIFDIGNVLVRCDWQAVLAPYKDSPEKRDAIANATFYSPQWKEVDRGVLTREEVLARMVRLAPQYADDVRRVFNSAKDAIQQYDYTKPLLCELRSQGLKTYFLSNYGEDLYEETKQELDFIPLMDGGIFSYEVKLIKPDRWIYEELLLRYGIDRTRAVFFDDIPKNVDAARNAGLPAYPFTGCEEAKEIIKKLRTA